VIPVQSRYAVPFIGRWLYRADVTKIAKGAKSGEVAAIGDLAGVVYSDSDPVARCTAGTALRSLSRPEQVDAICRETLVHTSPALAAIIRNCGYLPSDPGDRALYCFCTGSRDTHSGSGNEWPADLLARGYRRAGIPIRARARNSARTNHLCPVLARALRYPGMPGPREWTYDEWAIVIDGLSEKKEWPELWILVREAPVPLAVGVIAAIRNAGWAPPGDDRMIWEKILATLPGRWTYPAPKGGNLPVMKPPSAQVSRIAFSPDGSLLATIACDEHIQIRRTATGSPVAEIAAGPESGTSLLITRDNRYLVTSGNGSTIHCHNLQEHDIAWMQATGGEITVLSPSPDNGLIFAGDDRGILNILDQEDGRIIRSLRLHPSPVTCLAISHDGTTAACGHADGTVSLAGNGGAADVRILPTATADPVSSVTFGPDGKQCLILFVRALPTLWNGETGSRIRTFTGHAGQAVCSAISPAEGWFALGSSDHTLRYWHWQEERPAIALPLYSRSITCCTATPDGRYLAAGFSDGSIRTFRMPGLALVREYKGHRRAVTACAISPDDSRCATAGWDGTTKLWRFPDGEIVRTWDTHAGRVAALAGPGRGSLIAAVTHDGIARLHNGKDGGVVRTIDLYTPSVRTAAMSPDGMYLASAGADGSLRIWNIHDGSLVSAGKKLATSHRCCTFLPGRARLFCGGWDGKCRIFSVPEGRLLRTFGGHTSVVTSCDVTRDGALIVTGSNDTTVRIWHSEEDAARTVITGSRTEIGAVAISPDGTLLAAGGADKVIRLYRLPGGEPSGDLFGIPGKTTTLSFDESGTLLVAGYDAGTLSWYSVPAQEIIRTTAAHAGTVTGSIVLPGSDLLVTSGGDGTCQFHPLPVAGSLPAATPADMARILAEAGAATGTPAETQWQFLYRLLAARFQNEIEIPPFPGVIGCYDIQIAG
jgi:WD40 repeat protein